MPAAAPVEPSGSQQRGRADNYYAELQDHGTVDDDTVHKIGMLLR